MITEKQTTLLQLVKKLLPESETQNSPAGIEVSSWEKFCENPLNGIGHICNCITYGHSGIRQVCINGFKESDPTEKRGIVIANPYNYSPFLQVEVYSPVPDSFDKKIQDYVLKKAETVEKFLVDGAKTIIADKLGTKTEEILISNLCPDESPSIIITSETWEPGYLIRDILSIMEVSFVGDSPAEVLIDKNLKERAYYSALTAAKYLAVPLGFAFGLLEKIGIDIDFEEEEE